MTQTPLPFKLRDMFFTNIHTRRAGTVPEIMNLNITVGVRMDAAQLPRLEVGVRIAATTEEDSFSIEFELVSIFEAAGNAVEIDKPALVDFVNDKAVPLMWPQAELLGRQLVSTMGMPPIRFILPLRFELLPDQFLSDALEVNPV